MITQESLFGLMFVDNNNGWVVGNSGNIIHTENGGAVWISTSPGHTREIDKQIRAYPNPFQEQLRIEILLPCTDVCELMIINQLGQLIIKKQLRRSPGGSLFYEWDLGEATGGIYHILVQSGGKTLSTKVIRHNY